MPPTIKNAIRPGCRQPSVDSSASSNIDPFHIFCTPSLSRHRAPDHEKLVERARFHLQQAEVRKLATSAGDLQTYVFEPEGRCYGSVLIVHGWTGEAAFMSPFALHLRRRGLRSVLFDLPAHGKSSGRKSNLIDCGHAALEVAEAMGPMRFALGHSIGASAILAAGEGHSPLPRSYSFEAYVLVAIPDRCSDLIGRFGSELCLSPRELRAFERRLEKIARRPIKEFNASNLLATLRRPALILHSRDDDEVPFSDAVQIASANSSAELAVFDGLGHRGILYAPPAVRAAGNFLTRLIATDSAHAFTVL
jgi:pimeloyl-ACP methyl ester carboxylesterase